MFTPLEIKKKFFYFYKKFLSFKQECTDESLGHSLSLTGFRWRHRFGREKETHRVLKKIAIVGAPNVGKSVLFNNLTGTYVTVSNYPGTTVEVSRGTTQIGGEKLEVIDTPGMYSLLPITEEERVARDIVINETPKIIIHVVDAKNLERMVPVTLQLIEAGFNTLLVLNIMDEAERLGLDIDTNRLQQELGIPVISTVSTTGRGMDILKGRIEEYAQD